MATTHHHVSAYSPVVHEDRPLQGQTESTEDVHIRTFLIADMRGWTRFTQERGDEAAAKLAAKFADIAREGVEARGGTLLELRGDEAVCVFSSTRESIRAAVDLQRRFVQETLREPELPLTFGIGLDAGEAVAVQGGYRGGALNLAARLCGEARAGEILASREVTHLARRVDGIRYEDRGPLLLKGLDEPIVVVRVVPEGEDPVERLRPFAPSTPSRGAEDLTALAGRRRDRRCLGARRDRHPAARVRWRRGRRCRDELDRADERRGGEPRLRHAAGSAPRCERDRLRERMGRRAGP